MTKAGARVRLALMLSLLPHLALLLSQAQAQSPDPWATTLLLTRKTLAVGECSMASLDLRDASGMEWPRGPGGARIAMTDFDFAVSAPAERAAVGQYNGGESFAVCACPKAPVGTVATVTATYPAKYIAAKARVPGVSFTTSTTVPIAAGASSGNPPGCDAPNASRGGPWLVTMRPAVSALAIGSCSAVSMTLRDSTGKDTPRNPLGGRISLADFDMSATTANGADVVGKYDGASSFAACACQTGTVGEAATIMARYPAQHLEAKARVPGVEMQVTAPLTLAAAKGSSNPTGCGATQIASAVGGATGAGERDDAPAGAAPSRGDERKRKPDAGVSPVPDETGAIAPAAPTIRAAPPALKGPVVGTPRTGGAMPPAPPPPTNVAVTGTPMNARITWAAVAGAQRYAVWRGDGKSVSIERTPAAFTATQYLDVMGDAQITYYYTVVAYYANGTSAEASAVNFKSPPLVNPPGFTAKEFGVPGGGQVTFAWQPVPNALRYRLDGPGLPVTGYFASAASTTTAHPHMPAGPGTWRLQALYTGNVGDSAGASLASTVVHVLPSHLGQWLTHRNGAGTLDQVETPAHQEYDESAIGNWSGNLLGSYDASYAIWLGQPLRFNPAYGFYSDTAAQPCALGTPSAIGCSIPGLKSWLNLGAIGLWDDPGQGAKEAVYGNPTDLGVGRRAYCEQLPFVPPQKVPLANTPGAYTVCYATAHGSTPGTAGFNDPQTITHPLEGIGSDFILAMMIIKDPSGTVFLVLGKNGKYPLLNSVGLDTEGPKLVPFACIACHGGTYNTTTHKVDGSSFLPLDPSLLSFASPADKAAQEEKIRKINLMIHDAQPRTAIAQYLNGLYNGAIGSPGATAVPDYVPASWSGQAGFYRDVVRPNCTMCHLAAPESWNFASLQNFTDNAGLIYADVCIQHSMPHAEVPFKSFWLKQTGALYLPGLLATVIGKPSC
ncbi:MAG: hypothetical protein ABIQ10_10735 [Gemmatimonadaceae bacterium]